MKSEGLDEVMNQLKAVDSPSIKSQDVDKWDFASERFPRHPFPWNTFPSLIAESLQQVARSCATSDVAMPGAAITAMASAVGRTVSVSPKESWEEPLTLWFADIRPSGQGKTPATRQLLKPVYETQKKTDERYEAELEQWENAPDKKKRGAAPKRPAGHFVTDLTIEGLRADIQQGHGGLVCSLDEVSSMITGQNQFKLKGNDREAWISLWDGHDTRISRASKSVTIRGARISIFGGIQPEVFKIVFNSNNGIFRDDGTIYRFLLTYEYGSVFEITDESWTPANRWVWESTLKNAIAWSENIISNRDWKTHVLRLTDDARVTFYNWCNNIKKQITLLPASIQGFIPKSISYVLRIAGVLHCMSHFFGGTTLGAVLNNEDIIRAISVVEFYLAHTVSALRFMDNNLSSVDINKTTSTLSKTLASLHTSLDSGRLAVGYIYEKFNEQCDPILKIKSEKAMGTLLRDHGLTILPGKHDANGHRGVCCLTWDEKTEQIVRTLQTSTEQGPQGEAPASTGSADIADFADIAGEEYDIEGNILC